jgi:hypothetical protein
MTTTVVARPTTTPAFGSRYGTADIVKALIAQVDTAQATAITLPDDVKWVNFHNVVYKKAQSQGFKLHYSRNGRTLTMWLTRA